MLEVRPLENIDYELIKEAEKVIEKNYRYERHHIGSAVRTKTGKIYSAVHVGSECRKNYSMWGSDGYW